MRQNEEGGGRMSSIEQTIRNLTKAQRSALDHFASGGTRKIFTQRTLAKLKSLGLIVSEQVIEPIGRGAEFRFTRYDVPTPVHMAWCAVCSEEFDALSDDAKAAMEAPDYSP